MKDEEKQLGFAGKISQTFIRSKLTMLIVLGSLLLGALAVLELPREEEPQIRVPVFDIFVPFPGAGAREVEERIINVGERKLWEIPGVEYIYSTARPNGALFIVRFKVGTSFEKAMTLVYTKTFANADLLPPGAGIPVIKPRSIDDVPILALTLWGPGFDGLALRQAAAVLRQEISSITDVSQINIIGGKKRRLFVHLNPAKLKSHRLTPMDVLESLKASNSRVPAGHYTKHSENIAVDADSLIRSASDLRRIVVGISSGRPVLLGDVADIVDGADEKERALFFSPNPTLNRKNLNAFPAVTIDVSKRRGANATDVAQAALERVKNAQNSLLPKGIHVTVMRNYGATAKEKSDELLFHMLLATLSVSLLIALALGWREALVVLVAIPVTLSLTLLVYFLAGYTLNRITLFALIFSIGILVDDAIVVVENIHRHYQMGDGRPIWKLAVEATDEVGNPTLLATWAVIAAIMPMAFVRGLMGPYMRPIPVGASFAMVFSVAIAFIVSPWAFSKILERWKLVKSDHLKAESAPDRFYRKMMGLLLRSQVATYSFLISVIFLLGAAISLFYFKAVVLKMLPFDNKDEFEVIVNMPGGSSFSLTQKASLEMAERLKSIPEVLDVATYVGTAAPYNFNGLVRHYFLRHSPDGADLAVRLIHFKNRKKQSHEIAQEARKLLIPMAKRYQARFQVAEVPPGPPVLSTLVLEFYGPDKNRREQLALRVEDLLKKTAGVVDVDSYFPFKNQNLEKLKISRLKSALNGISPSLVAQTSRIAIHGETVGIAHIRHEKEPVKIRIRLASSSRHDMAALLRIPLLSRNGNPIPLGHLVSPTSSYVETPIYHKNLRSVSYVIADVAGGSESPVYTMLQLGIPIQKIANSMGMALNQYYSSLPAITGQYALKWDGEWQITYEVFRDLGIAFALALILIYILVVGWFESFSIPLVIMAPIPLTLVGIIPAHWMMHAFFTATSMIGFIAGAGIVVRNSIILVDFIQLRMKQGMPLQEAVIDAGAVRFRPMLLTAAAVVVGASVILFDPIFQGLAISLMAGEVASTLLSRTAVPVIYYLLMRGRKKESQNIQGDYL
jgi:multidrug efflux pump subunit AcrB